MFKIKRKIKKIKKTRHYIYFMLTFASLIYALSIQSFVFVSRILPSGLSSISTLFAIIFPLLGPYITIIYLILNFPLIIWVWKKLENKIFLYRSIYFLVCQAIIGAIFIIKPINNFLINMITSREDTLKKVWPIFLLSGIAGIFNGFSYSLTWKYGGSNGGSNFITYYFSQKKEKPIGNISFLVSIFFVIFSFLIALILKEEIRNNFVPILLANILYTGIVSSIINSLYPRYSKVKVEIHSEKINLINKYLKKKYRHAWKIIEFESGYTGLKKKMISTNMLLIEFHSFKHKIKKVDPNVWISVQKSIKIVGFFDSSYKIK
jgi:uncharacterized membrane-anchored protein YitT (DUF2179 family)